jgi:hypothetical protein
MRTFAVSQFVQCRALAGLYYLDAFAWQIGWQAPPARMAPTQRRRFGGLVPR